MPMRMTKEVVPEDAGLPEESTEERKAAKKGFFPSSMGLSFLVAGVARHLRVVVRWGEYKLVEMQGDSAPTPIIRAGIGWRAH